MPPENPNSPLPPHVSPTESAAPDAPIIPAPASPVASHIANASVLAPGEQQPLTGGSAPNMNGIDNSIWSFLARKWFIFAPILILAIVFGFRAPFISVVLVVAFLAVFKSIYENNLFKAFAAANKFAYDKDGIVPAQTGHLFFVGNSQHISDIITGKYQNWPLQLFLYKYDIGMGRDRHTYHRAVATVDFGTVLPTFILRRRYLMGLTSEEGDRITTNGYSEKLQLEGDFNQHFQVFIPPHTEQEVLTILTPDIMELMVPLDRYEIEMTPAGAFYIYTFKYITKKEELIDIYRILQSLVVKVGMYANRQNILAADAARAQTIQPQVAAPLQPPQPGHVE